MMDFTDLNTVAHALSGPLDRCRGIATDYHPSTGDRTPRYWSKHDHNGDSELVTTADVEISQVLSVALRTFSPGMLVLSEENADSVSEVPASCWIVDPIDGTGPYTTGSDFFAVSVAAQVDGILLVGALDFPALGLRIVAVSGSGLRVYGNATSAFSRWRGSLLIGARDCQAVCRHEIPNLSESLSVLPTASCKIAAVAVGGARGAAASLGGRGAMCWDIAAAMVIAREAGCYLLDHTGQDLRDPLPWHIPAWAVGRSPLELARLQWIQRLAEAPC